MSIKTMTTVEQQHASGVVRRAGVVSAAVAAAVVVWWLLHAVLGAHLAVRSGSSEITIGVSDVALTALLVGCAGWCVLGLIERRRSCRARRPWTWLAIAVLLMSLLGPLGATSMAAGLGLLALHLTVGLIVIMGLRSTAC